MYKLLAQHYDRKEIGYPFPFVYLHGKIEEINGYDIVTKEINEDIPFGIHHVIVSIQDKEYKCKLFTWDCRSDEKLNFEKQRKEQLELAGCKYEEEPRWTYQKGLICLNNDNEAIKDAYKKYKERRSHI